MILERVLQTIAKRGLLLAIAAIGLTSASALTYAGLAPWARANAGEAQQGSQSFVNSEGSFQTLTEFINRSPGERGEVDRIKGRIKSAFPSSSDGASPPNPTQRALGKIFDPEPFSITAAQEDPIALLTSPISEVGTPAGLIPLGPAIISSSPTGSGPNIVPGSLAFAPPTSSPPGENSGGGGSGNPAPLPVAAVPEPSTWALMMMGFFMAGFALRRSNTKTKRRATLVTN